MSLMLFMVSLPFVTVLPLKVTAAVRLIVQWDAGMAGCSDAVVAVHCPVACAAMQDIDRYVRIKYWPRDNSCH
ncbi:MULTISPECIES: hypothetical protein [Microvirgula]|uniref:hypothetical protein n=1 Tax=Microvirgula TaxID=57479 RepID=UPI0011BFA12A|nr:MULTISPECIES: hypothetical protein [Microvirgula]